jgi:type III secretory pathway component EscS
MLVVITIVRQAPTLIAEVVQIIVALCQGDTRPLSEESNITVLLRKTSQNLDGCNHRKWR